MYVVTHYTEESVSTEVEYNDAQIRNISFAPETDLTLASLPVCKLELDILTDVKAKAFISNEITLYEGDNAVSSRIFAARYEIYNAEQRSDACVHIIAESPLKRLDGVVLPAEYFEGNAEDFVRGIFYNVYGVEIDTGYPYTFTPFDVSWTYFQAFCPEQTAKERLQMFCQSGGYAVLQWGPDAYKGLRIEAAETAKSSATLAATFASEDVYQRPRIREVQIPERLEYTWYSNWSESYNPGDARFKFPIRYEYDLEDGGKTPIYIYAIGEDGEIYDQARTVGKGTVKLDNTILHNRLGWDFWIRGYLTQLYNKAYGRQYEIEVDVLYHPDKIRGCMPGSVIYFYCGHETVYDGVVKSSRFTFGKRIRASMVVATTLTPLSSFHWLTIKYVYEKNGVTRLLGEQKHYLQQFKNYSFINPTFILPVVDRVERFTPRSTYTSVSMPNADRTETAYYNRA